MTRRQRQRMHRLRWKQRLLREYPSMIVSPELYEWTCRHLGRGRSRTWKGRHGGRREQWPAVRMEQGKLIWARDLKAGESFTMTAEQMAQLHRQSSISDQKAIP